MNHSNDAAARLVLEAADWARALRRAPDKNLYDAFDQWVRASPAHLRCFLEQSAIDDALIRSGFADRHTAEEWVALGRLDDDEEDFDPAAPAEARSGTPAVAPAQLVRANWSTSRFGGLVLAGSVAICLLAASWWQWWSWDAYAFAETTRTITPITLPDGSEVQPYAGSLIKVRDVANRRDVRLIRGGARFEVHHDPRNPFRVERGNLTIVALGTAFNVLIKGEQTGVYVSDGRVLLTANGNSITLGSGQSADVSAGGHIDSVQPAGPRPTAGAEDPEPGFEKITLGDMAAALNRLNRVPQFVVMGSARDRLVLAPKHLDDPEKWFRVLSGYEEFDVVREGNVVTVRLRGPAQQ